jgi:alpha-L-fucosidase
MDRYGIPQDRYVDEHILPQLRELVTRYRPAVIFSDAGEWDEDEEYWKTREFLAWLYNNAPNREEVVVNDRWAKGMPGNHGDYYSSEYQDTDAVGAGHPWEESRGMGRSYGYNRAENIDHYRTSKELVHELIDVVSHGGNLLLNVGPTADGRIPVIMQQRLRDMGSWLRINGEAIYSSRPCPGSRGQGLGDEGGSPVRCTQRGSDLYVHLLGWPDGEIDVAGLGSTEGVSVELLGYVGPIDWRIQGSGVVITPPRMSPAQMPSPYAYVFKISGALG